jgi:hypothetical protein
VRYFPTDAAAARTASIESCGCDTIETCEPATSVIVEPARSAIDRWVAGGMTRSSVPTTAQLGIVFHAVFSVGATFLALLGDEGVDVDQCPDVATLGARVRDHDPAVGVADQDHRAARALRMTI